MVEYELDNRVKMILFAIALLAVPVVCTAASPIDFNRDVRPILSDRCFQCHGPDEHERQASLRLDQAGGDDGAYRELDGSIAIKPGSVDASALWERINSDDEDLVMPPADSPKKPLTDDERSIIKRWIEDGAKYADFWAFVTPQRPTLPDVEATEWSKQAIDQFVLHQLEQRGMSPQPTADRRTLIRRLSLDLTGIPPTREEIRDFLADDSTGAYERLVDRLLAKSQYGEHMAKYWLDLVRFADTNGVHHDHYREMTPYRDWVIRAFNEDLPYNDFVKFQLAGDLYADATHDQLIASGFNRLHLIIDRGTALPEESFTRNVTDRVTAVGTAFMGLTVQCAVCHDHKYDPISTRDFYQLFAFFNNLDGTPETGGRQGTDFKRGLQPPYVRLADATQEAKLAEMDERIKDAQAEVKRLEQERKQATDEAEQKTLAKELKDQQQTLKKAQAERNAFDAQIPVAMVMKEKADPRPTHILIRGAYDQPGEKVERNSPGFLPPMPEKKGARTRMDLAEWFVSDNHPLTARVAANRFWQQLFGVGIVKTSEDFGAQGDWPSHPQLLDHLAVSFRESGWSVKALMKQIVMSETYKQSSAGSPEEFKTDPENRLLSRGSRFRLDAEVIRDQVLATSGLLKSQLYGKSVKPPQPKGLWDSVSMPSSYPRLYEPDAGDKIYRRSVYTFWKRGMPPPQMTILNAPSREACIARRERTNTPLQALLLMNEPEFLKAARHLAHATLNDRSLKPQQRLERLYETITSQLPDSTESKDFLKMASDLESIYKEDAQLAGQLCEGLTLGEGISQHELAAWTIVVNAIYNLDITKTRN